MANVDSNQSINPQNVYQILRVDDVPTRITFNKMLTMVESYARHIIGVARTADYAAKRLGTSIYFYCTSQEEALFLEDQEFDFVGDGRGNYQLTIVDTVVGRAKLPDQVYSNRFECKPVTVRITGLDRYNNKYEGYTEYLRSIVPYFENRGRVTGIRLGYDLIKRKTRKDGFVTYLCQLDATEVVNAQNVLFRQPIGATLSFNVPMLVSMQNSQQLHNGLIEWSREAEAINLLMVRHENPFVHPSNDELDLFTGDSPFMRNAFSFQLPNIQIIQPTHSSKSLPQPVKPSLKSVIVAPTNSDNLKPSTSGYVKKVSVGKDKSLAATKESKKDNVKSDKSKDKINAPTIKSWIRTASVPSKKKREEKSSKVSASETSKKKSQIVARAKSGKDDKNKVESKTNELSKEKNDKKEFKKGQKIKSKVVATCKDVKPAKIARVSKIRHRILDEESSDDGLIIDEKVDLEDDDEGAGTSRGA